MGQDQMKETLWRIHIKNTKKEFILRYTEQEGIIESVTLGFSENEKDDKFVKVTPKEFRKINAIMKSFEDLMNTEEMIQDSKIQHPPRILLKKNEESEFTPSDQDEWDPW